LKFLSLRFSPQWMACILWEAGKRKKLQIVQVKRWSNTTYQPCISRRSKVAHFVQYLVWDKDLTTDTVFFLVQLYIHTKYWIQCASKIRENKRLTLTITALRSGTAASTRGVLRSGRLMFWRSWW
jgi:hypothetical protein